MDSIDSSYKKNKMIMIMIIMMKMIVMMIMIMLMIGGDYGGKDNMIIIMINPRLHLTS